MMSSEKFKERKAFIILINDKPYEVWYRHETHELGKMNNCSDNLWIKYNDRWEPYIRLGCKQVCFFVTVKEMNRAKIKWGKLRVSGFCSITISCNGRQVYGFSVRDIDYGLARAQVLVTEMTEHPFNFTDPDSEVGRRIWYHEQPAVIDRLILDQGAMIVRKDDEEGFDLSKPWWDEEDMNLFADWHGKPEVKTDILSDEIYWFRGEK